MFEPGEDKDGPRWWKFDDDQGRIWEMWWYEGSTFLMGEVPPLPEPPGYYFTSDQAERFFLYEPSPSQPQSEEDCRRLLLEARERGGGR